MILGYTRCSTLEQSDPGKSSLTDQENKIRGIALMRSEPEPVFYTDKGVSGSIPLARRPSGGRMITDARKGDIIVAAKMDRIFRSTVDALTQVDKLRNKEIGLILVDINTEPVTSEGGVGRVYLTMLAAFAEFERWRIAERLNDGKRGKKARGGHIGGSPPYGWTTRGKGRDSELIPNPEEQRVVACAMALRERGLSLRRILNELTQRGFNDRAGTGFDVMQVHRMLRRAGQQQQAGVQ